jgi:hypothetical protein
MNAVNGASYDPETLDLLRRVLDEIWISFSLEEQRRVVKSEIAARLLKAATDGELDPARLRARALANVVSPRLASTGS